MGIKEVLSAPRSPWQRAYIERVIGSIRRECLDHLIVFNERSLVRHLQAYVDYYHRTRTHLALQKDRPEPAPCANAGCGLNRLDPGNRWTSSSLRAPGCLKRRIAIKRDRMAFPICSRPLRSVRDWRIASF